MPQTISHDILVAALAGFKLEQQQLEAKIAHVEAILKGGSVASSATPAEAPTGKRRKRSAAARRRMAEAQKARWAKLKAASEPESTPEPPKAKREMSATARAAIGAATKKRWALKRAEEKKAQSTVGTKKSPKTVKKSAKTTRKAVTKKAAPAMPEGEV